MRGLATYIIFVVCSTCQQIPRRLCEGASYIDELNKIDGATCCDVYADPEARGHHELRGRSSHPMIAIGVAIIGTIFTIIPSVTSFKHSLGAPFAFRAQNDRQFELREKIAQIVVMFSTKQVYGT